MLDSTQIQQDTVIAKDTIKDSIIIVQDTFAKEMGSLRNETFRSESWVFAVVLFLFLFFIFSFKKSFGWIKESISNFSRVKTRASLFSNATQSEYSSRHLLTVFSIGVLSLLIYILNRPFDSKIYFEIYLMMFGAILFYIIIKHLIFNIIAYTFFEKEISKLVKEQFYLLFSFLGITLFPLLLARIYLPDINHQTILIITLSIAFIYPLILVIKLMQIFSGKFLELFYILLYLCTLEIIPLALMSKLVGFIISINNV